MTERSSASGQFVSKEPRPPQPAELHAEIAELTARRAALEAQVRDKFLDCALANSFGPIAPLTAQLREFSERITTLQGQLPESERAEQDRLAEAKRREATSRARAIFAHSNRARAGVRDVALAINGFRVAYEKMVDGFDGIGATLDEPTGFELAPDWREAIDSRVMADVITAMRGTSGASLAELAEPAIEAARAAAGEMARGADTTDPSNPGMEPADDTTEPEQQEASDV